MSDTRQNKLARNDRNNRPDGDNEDGRSGRNPDGVSRRRLLGTASAVGAAGLALGAAGGAAASAAYRSEPAPVTALTTLGTDTVAFHGAHQPGITTPLHARGHLVAFDLAPGAGRKEASALLRRWSASARALMAGEPAMRPRHRCRPGQPARPPSPSPSASAVPSSTVRT